MVILPAIFGISGQSLTDAERDLFRERAPFGFILFRRNIDTPEQLKKLTDSLRELTGRADTPILIDQEGGRVQRLRPPHWVDLPHTRALGDLYKKNREAGIKATKLQTQTIAGMIAEAGFTTVCAPVLDVPVPGAHDVIGKRAFAEDVETVVALGTVMTQAFLDCGIMPILKHIPGHGRAIVDSHDVLPVVDAEKAVLDKTDFATFKNVVAAVGPEKLWAMTAHIVFTKIDKNPVSLSEHMVGVLRNDLGISGFIIPDAIEMEALHGTQAERALASLKAGCDVTMHCSGVFDDVKAIAAVLPDMSDKALARFAATEAARKQGAQKTDWRETYKELRGLITDDENYVYTHHQALSVA